MGNCFRTEVYSRRSLEKRRRENNHDSVFRENNTELETHYIPPSFEQHPQQPVWTDSDAATFDRKQMRFPLHAGGQLGTGSMLPTGSVENSLDGAHLNFNTAASMIKSNIKLAGSSVYRRFEDISTSASRLFTSKVTRGSNSNSTIVAATTATIVAEETLRNEVARLQQEVIALDARLCNVSHQRNDLHPIPSAMSLYEDIEDNDSNDTDPEESINRRDYLLRETDNCYIGRQECVSPRRNDSFSERVVTFSDEPLDASVQSSLRFAVPIVDSHSFEHNGAKMVEASPIGPSLRAPTDYELHELHNDCNDINDSVNLSGGDSDEYYDIKDSELPFSRCYPNTDKHIVTSTYFLEPLSGSVCSDSESPLPPPPPPPPLPRSAAAPRVW